MNTLYKRFIRPQLFKRDPEDAHEFAVEWLQRLSKQTLLCRTLENWNLLKESKPIRLFGLTFPNAVGLAPGMDKNARFWQAAGALGFGHVEIGTVTCHRQPGNPRPRVFRFPEQNAIINRMGFNNDGAKIVAQRIRKDLKRGSKSIILGINIGKSKITPIDQAIHDYLESFELLADLADYLVVNVSSPNTPDLRKLQQSNHLRELLGSLMDANHEKARKENRSITPILVKIAPDLTFREIDQVLEIATELKLAGIVATNTTIERPGRLASANETGGLSGRPLHRRSVEIINYISKATNRKLPIIGVGGIYNPRTAGETMDAGASLIQIYTGMVYEGPLLARTLAKALRTKQSEWNISKWP